MNSLEQAIITIISQSPTIAMLIYLLFQERQERKSLSNDLKESHNAHVTDLKHMLKIERPVNTDD